MQWYNWSPRWVQGEKQHGMTRVSSGIIWRKSKFKVENETAPSLVGWVGGGVDPVAPWGGGGGGVTHPK